VMFRPSSGASMALMNALPMVTRRMINGNLMATKSAWLHRRAPHRPE
jgi:hypothetical protein